MLAKTVQGNGQTHHQPKSNPTLKLQAITIK